MVFGPRICFLAVTVLTILLVGACAITKTRPDISFSIFILLLAWAFQSTVCTAFCYQLSFRGAWNRLLRRPVGLVFLIPIAILLVTFLKPFTGTEFAVFGFTLFEFQKRGGNWKRIRDAAFVFLYLLWGFEIALVCSSLIITVRSCTQFDAYLARIDSHLLFGSSVVALSNRASALYGPAEMIYWGIGGVAGTGILFLCISGDRRSAYRMSSTILVAYWLSLLIFYIVPAQGPFIFSTLPPNLPSAALQIKSIVSARMLFHHQGWIVSPPAFYVSFPSMHMAVPVIVAWSLRKWRSVLIILATYCLLVVPAILILRWHYFVDVIAGFLVAVIALIVVETGFRCLRLNASTRSDVVLTA